MWIGLFAVRTVMTVLRSVHEIVWAILFLQALGAEPMAAVLAIAIPYSATLGKVFSELIDEAPKETPNALRDNGATRLQVYVFALLPMVIPDLLAYLLYRPRVARDFSEGSFIPEEYQDDEPDTGSEPDTDDASGSDDQSATDD